MITKARLAGMQCPLAIKCPKPSVTGRSQKSVLACKEPDFSHCYRWSLHYVMCLAEGCPLVLALVDACMPWRPGVP